MATNAAATAQVVPASAEPEYRTQAATTDWSAAIAAAQQQVASAREQAPQQPLALADALVVLGSAHLGATDYVAAEAAFVEALKLVEQHSGAASANLLDPLRGLGYTLAASGRHREAVPLLDRALLINRRSHGLFDVGQQGVLRQLATSLRKSGRAAEAARHVQYLVEVGARAYGRRDPRQVPILCFAADWHADIGNFSAARVLYREAVDMSRKKPGAEDLTVAIQPLRGLARSYTQELHFSIMGLPTDSIDRTASADGTSNDSKPLNPRYLGHEGQKALERAVTILEAQQPVDTAALALSLIELGDWFQIKHQPEKAFSYYRRAAALNAQANGATPSAPPPPLSFPVILYYPTPQRASRHVTLPAEQVDETFVEVQFTVTEAGDVEDAKIAGQDGTPRQASETLQAIRAAKFRPKFVNGEPVETAGMTKREVFRTRRQESEGSAG